MALQDIEIVLPTLALLFNNLPIFSSPLMDTRRDFIKKATMLTGAGWAGLLPESISKAMAINPAPGSSYLDAEHVVVLMQENRSFDHCFGSLKGVRGFNDPRFIHLPDGKPVWLQSNADGETYAPFHFDMHGTKITWMGTTPHSRSSQVDANNLGKYDRWLDVKKVNHKGSENMPMTMGYYTRKDVPFNYALADAFTVCDQNFCSAMTSTWPNRLFLWSGTIRGEQNGDAKAYIRNEIPYGEAHWKTFPEMLEDHSVSWKVYQNDLSAGGGFAKGEREWLSNFGCNPLEYLSQFNVRFSPRYVAGLKAQTETMPGEIEKLQASLAALTAGDSKKDEPKGKATRADKAGKLRRDIAKKEGVLHKAHEELKLWSQENFDKLSPEAKNLYQKAFATNTGDPDYHQLTTLSYEEGAEKRELRVPKGDILHQFRQDVNNGQLPAVSWLVGPANFTDHPVSPWYGSWYVSEILDILTKNPEVWKKTIFILTYDENDGYFDHIPPFVAPDPLKPEMGKCSPGIDTSVEYIRRERELADGVPSKEAREGPAGLGYRVPMIIASPWTRGGRVCSQVFDHTSVFRFIQDLLNKKMGKQIAENNISLWRKTVCGDLTSAFRPYEGGTDKLNPLERTSFLQGIHNAKFKPAPTNFKALSAEEIAHSLRNPRSTPHLPQQEPGMKPSCALPYQLYAEALLSEDKKSITIEMEARKEVFGDQSAGSPFNIYVPGRYAVVQEEGKEPAFEAIGSRSYAVIAGGNLADSWPVSSFEDGLYHLRVYGPNGFYREHRGSAADPDLLIRCEYERSPKDARKLTGNVQLIIKNLNSHESRKIEVKDHAYGAKSITQALAAGTKEATIRILLDQTASHGWYDFSITVPGFDQFEKRYAGRVETGADSFSDPLMGRVS
jgi:phospholipase C